MMKLKNPQLVVYSTNKSAKGNKYYKRFVMTAIAVIAILTIINIIKN